MEMSDSEIAKYNMGKNRLLWIDVHLQLSVPYFYVLCESKEVKVTTATDGEVISPSIRLPSGKLLYKGVSSQLDPQAASLTGDTWLEVLTEITDVTLKQLPEFLDEYHTSDEFLSTLKNAFGIFLEAMAKGPTSLRICDFDSIRKVESASDARTTKTILDEDCRPKADSGLDAFFVSIGIIAYWIRQGSAVNCPFAKLLAKLYDIGFFEMTPMFGLRRLEEVRPILKECKEAYGFSDVLTMILEECCFKDNGSLCLSEEMTVSSSVGLFFAMAKEEWLCPTYKKMIKDKLDDLKKKEEEKAAVAPVSDPEEAHTNQELDNVEDG
jgi:hypothetical protein